MRVIEKISDKLYQALYVSERAEIINKHGIYSNVSEKELNLELDRWKQENYFNDSYIEKKLKSEGLTKYLFSRVLLSSKDKEWAEKVKRLEKQPVWFKRVEEAFELNRVHNVEKIINNKQVYELAYAFRPFLLWANEKISLLISDFLEKIDLTIELDELLNSLIINLEKLLTQTGLRTMVFELHVAKELGELNGNSSESRYTSFVKDKLMDPDYLEFIYAEQPALTRIMMNQTVFYVNNIKECIERFARDYEEIIEVFGIGGDTLITIETDLGDSHQEGKSVMVFKFSSGKEILYKPKSLKLAKHFTELLRWFNSKGFKYQFKPYRILNFESYSWEEKVENRSCSNNEQLERYHYRLGGLIGVLYLLRGVDFHSENIIAVGEHPTLIDLETLFHHRMQFPEDERYGANAKAVQKIEDSVISIGLLPHLSFKTSDGKGIDLGGMSYAEAEIPGPLLSIVNNYTDEVRFEYRNSIVNLADQNVPKINEKIVESTDYISEIISGFTDIGRIALKYKNELLNEKGPVLEFKNDPIRIILRPTQHYANFIMEGSHPDYMRNWIERDKLMDKIWFSYLDKKVIPYEKMELLKNDIPVFFSTPGSKNLISGTGDIIKDYYEQTSLSLVIERIEDLTEEDIHEQKRLIEMILLAKKGNERKSEEPKESFTLKNINYEPEKVIREAIEIGDKLIEASISGDIKELTWVSLDVNYFGQWDISVLRNGLYSGLSGILIFSTYLYKITKKERFKELAQNVCETITNFPILAADFKSAYFGQTSVIYALTHYIKVFGANKKVIAYVKNSIEQAGEKVKEDKHYDILGGSAGIIQVLINAYEELGYTEALKYAELYGDHLLENQTSTSNGSGWINSDTNEILGGFSHGTSGIAWSLLRLHKHSKEEKYLQGALKAIEFDRSLYDSDRDNWIDLRNTDADTITWCHGAAGIGMSRLLFLEYLKDEELEKEIDIALSTTLKRGLGSNDSLCHGDLGNSELFCMASTTFKEKEYLNIARKIGMNVIEKKNRTGRFTTGAPNNIETPGLFVGTSGIGFQLLRLVAPEEVPSILTLQ